MAAVENNSIPISSTTTTTTAQPVVNPKNVPYQMSKTQYDSIRSNLMEAINAGFDGWKNLFSSSSPETLANLDLSTTSRMGDQAPGQYIRTVQNGFNEADPEASWMTVPDRHLYFSPTRMDCYV